MEAYKSLSETPVKLVLDEFRSDGNAFSLMGKFKDAALKQGITKEEVQAVLRSAMKSGGYDNLLGTLLEYIEFVDEDEFNEAMYGREEEE